MKKLIVTGILLLSTPLHAQTVSQALRECGQQQNSLKRLVCYDRIVQSLDKYSGMDALMAVPAPLPANSANQQTDEQTALPRPRVMTPGDDFGLEHKQREDNQPERIYAQVTKIDKTPRKRLILTLDNGHTWKQTDSEKFFVKTGETIYIKRGLLGAFYLSKDSSNRKISVVRTK